MSHSEQNQIDRMGAVVMTTTSSSSPQVINKHLLEAGALKLMAAAQAGSTAAFDELQRLYSARIFKTILRITKNREDAEDVLQDTFLRAYLGLRYFQARSSVYCWLTRIAINSALMLLRRRRVRPGEVVRSSFEAEDFPAPLEIKDTAPNPEQMYELRERSDELLQAVQRLEPKFRGPIEIQLARESSMKEIADTLNISVAAVKSRLYRARARLAVRVGRNCGAKGDLPLSLIDTGVLASRRNGAQPCPAC